MTRFIAPALAAFALAGCTITQSPDERDFVAGFNEPFLQYVSAGSQLTFISPENMTGVEISTVRSQEKGTTRFAWTEDGNEMALLIKPGQCFDDMSGFEYSHTAQLLSDSYAGFMGCARLTTEAQPREP